MIVTIWQYVRTPREVSNVIVKPVTTVPEETQQTVVWVRLLFFIRLFIYLSMSLLAIIHVISFQH